jgi:hypothetical protein
MSISEIITARSRELSQKYHEQFKQGPTMVLGGLKGNYYTGYHLSKDRRYAFVSIEGIGSSGYGEDTINLKPDEALDLLKWLKDEEATLLKLKAEVEVRNGVS